MGTGPLSWATTFCSSVLWFLIPATRDCILGTLPHLSANLRPFLRGKHTQISNSWKSLARSTYGPLIISAIGLEAFCFYDRQPQTILRPTTCKLQSVCSCRHHDIIRGTRVWVKFLCYPRIEPRKKDGTYIFLIYINCATRWPDMIYGPLDRRYESAQEALGPASCHVRG